ncbi:MAG: VWA domain-containing protein [Planctomycetia bacterium]|nr:VWA domain-containing protein [Planctomycetia bacterium]
MEEYEYRNTRKSTFQWFSTWSISLFFHILILLILTLILEPVSHPGVPREATAEVGIVLKSTVDEKTVYESLEESHSPETESTTVQEEPTSEDAGMLELSRLVVSEEPLEIPSLDAALPGRPVSEGTKEGGLFQALDGFSGMGKGISAGTRDQFGRGKVTCFETTGEGNYFSFVFDCSGSMGGIGFYPLMAAKAELMTALQSLRPTQQFQIIFYNDRQYMFSKRVLMATNANRRKALQFLQKIVASGGTDHKTPLHMAISSRPDVIFFLTDAEEPALTAQELEEIRRNAAGTQINTIQFGFGPQATTSNFLMKLAWQNKGQYVYIDIQTLETKNDIP